MALQIADVTNYISAPLTAVANSQKNLADVTYNFIMSFLNSNANEEIYEPKYINFSYNINDTLGNVVQTKTVKVPLLSIVNVPSLKIKETTLEFSIEVKETEFYNETTQTKNLRFFGNLTSEKKIDRETNNTSNFSIKVTAVDDGIPEGLAKVLDRLNSSINDIAPEENVSEENSI